MSKPQQAIRRYPRGRVEQKTSGRAAPIRTGKNGFGDHYDTVSSQPYGDNYITGGCGWF